MSLPKYQCHKIVEAFKIAEIVPMNVPDPVAAKLLAEDGAHWHVTREYVEKHNPQVGGYFVLYPDEYESFSPAAAFESGYTLLGTEVEAPPQARGKVYEIRCADGLTCSVKASSTFFGDKWIWFYDEDQDEQVAGYKLDGIKSFQIVERDATTV